MTQLWNPAETSPLHTLLFGIISEHPDFRHRAELCAGASPGVTPWFPSENSSAEALWVFSSSTAHCFNCTAFPWANINDRTNSSANWKGSFPVTPRRAQLFQSIILPWLIDIRRSAKYITWFFFKYNRRHFKPFQIWLGWNSA